VAAELGLQGRLQKVNVSVLNGHVKAFETSPIECTIESLDGKTMGIKCCEMGSFTEFEIS